MNVAPLVEYLIQTPAARREIWAYAVNRGLGEGMQIERWLLIEMAARLMELKAKGLVQSAEGEHKFPIAKTRVFEHCDLWWTRSEIENWLEVKTIVLGEKKALGRVEDIVQDVAKRERLRPTDLFHYLAVIFPLAENRVNEWGTTLDPLYQNANMNFNARWTFPLWNEKRLAMFLYSARK
ncbi:MAG: hypothetical protein B6D41_13925 [Chloroflexi bacterium UTCFX4]|jgi:hypothetical protein|nr:MAG: hypothetical protein B6D41_13925 [Chloroflexi bacterium UTCFX4]